MTRTRNRATDVGTKPANGESSWAKAKWAMQLLNDVHFRVGRYYQSIGREDLAADAYGKYIHNREHGVGSIYDLAAAKRYAEQASR